MKIFQQGGECFALSSYQIKSAPIADDHTAGIALAKTLCEDACYLSASGNGQTALELVRIASKHTGGRILHLLTVRTHAPAQRDCVARQQAVCNGLLASLHQRGYLVGSLSFDHYKTSLAQINTESVWAIKKQDVQEYGVQGNYQAPAIVESVDWNKLYASLDGSGCAICIQIIPTLLADQERRMIATNTAHCCQAVDGVVGNLRDSLAFTSAERWKYFSKEMQNPFAQVNLLVCGSMANSALVTARIKQAITPSCCTTIPLANYSRYSIYNQPWRIALTLKQADQSSFSKWACEEVSKLFELPVSCDCFIGMDENPLSLLPETELLPPQLTTHTAQSLSLGRSIFSGQDTFLPLEQCLLHTAVLGKSGVGKTTLLKQLIAQIQKANIPVLILEPVKREYRDFVIGLKNSKIFTVERPVTPLLINPFYVPKGVSLLDYRSSLLSAFKAAFSLPDPLPALFEKAISEAYTQHGWTDISKSDDPNVTVFDMNAFICVFKRVLARSSYSGEVKGNMMSGGTFRLQSLIERCPRTFDTIHSTAVEDLLSGCAVLEMGTLEPEQKSLVSALTLISILAYLKATRVSDHRLRNVILIDEAHALLDQGEGTTQEEKSLSSTMTQLMINIITEIRAYGVGVIFSDQSPSRVGAQLLDNVDNIFSFRLSGEEAEKLNRHIGQTDRICEVLPLLSAGEFLLKNRFLRTALPIRMQPPCQHTNTHATDEQVVQAQIGYLASHQQQYRPFSSCEQAGCRCCSVAIREQANKCATQLFAQRQSKLKTPEMLAAHLMQIPAALSAHMDNAPSKKLCGCIAIHLLRRCAIENGIRFSPFATEKILTDLQSQKGGGSSV